MEQRLWVQRSRTPLDTPLWGREASEWSSRLWSAGSAGQAPLLARQTEPAPVESRTPAAAPAGIGYDLSTFTVYPSDDTLPGASIPDRFTPERPYFPEAPAGPQGREGGFPLGAATETSTLGVVQRCGATPCDCSPEERAAHEGLAEGDALRENLPMDHSAQRFTLSQQEPAMAVQRAAVKTLPPDTSTFWRVWGSQLQQAKRMFEEQRYGCWCGPGNVCSEVRDDIDQCCKNHDEAYAAAKVTSDSSPAAGSVSMWSIEGLKRTMAADLVLVACTQATYLDLHFYGPEAVLYREGVNAIFGNRARVAAAAFAIGALTPLLASEAELDVDDALASLDQAPAGAENGAAVAASQGAGADTDQGQAA